MFELIIYKFQLAKIQNFIDLKRMVSGLFFWFRLNILRLGKILQWHIRDCYDTLLLIFANEALLGSCIEHILELEFMIL